MQNLDILEFFIFGSIIVNVLHAMTTFLFSLYSRIVTRSRISDQRQQTAPRIDTSVYVLSLSTTTLITISFDVFFLNHTCHSLFSPKPHLLYLHAKLKWNHSFIYYCCCKHTNLTRDNHSATTTADIKSFLIMILRLIVSTLKGIYIHTNSVAACQLLDIYAWVRVNLLLPKYGILPFN